MPSLYTYLPVLARGPSNLAKRIFFFCTGGVSYSPNGGLTPTESNTSEHSDSGSDSQHLSKKSLKKKRNHENKRLRRMGLLTDSGKPTEKALADGLLDKDGRPTDKALAEGLLSTSHAPVHQPQVVDEGINAQTASGAHSGTQDSNDRLVANMLEENRAGLRFAL